MTIDKLLKCSAETLAGFSDEQLLAWFEEQGVLNVTRPERKAAETSGTKNASGSTKRRRAESKADMIMELALKLDGQKLAILREAGINLKDCVK